jgi:hypothetical protein
VHRLLRAEDRPVLRIRVRQHVLASGHPRVEHARVGELLDPETAQTCAGEGDVQPGRRQQRLAVSRGLRCRHRGALVQAFLHRCNFQGAQESPEGRLVLLAAADGEEHELLHLL